MLYLKQYVTKSITNTLSWSPESTKLLQVNEIVEWSCTAPNCSTFRINTLSHTVDEVTKYIENELSVKYQNDEIPQVKTHPELSECIVISRLKVNFSQLEPKSDEIMVDPICGAAVLRGANVYAPGVLAMEPKTKIGAEVSVYADIARNCLKGYKKRYISKGKLFLGNGIALMDRHQLFDNGHNPRGIAIKMKYTTSGVAMVDCPKEFGVLQNLPSMACVRALDPQPGETILDMCAAPGNKTTHIAALMRDEGTLIAIDKGSRIQLVNTNCEALNVRNCIRTFAGNSKQLLGESNRSPFVGPPFSPELFDRILLDTACSGLGNRPMLSNLVQTEKALRSFPRSQKAFIRNAVPLLKPGGVLVYSTCSFLCEENECNVAWLLENYSEMKLVPATPLLGRPGLLNNGLNNEQTTMVQRFGFGSQTEDSVGFFIAKFEKQARTLLREKVDCLERSHKYTH